MNTGIIKIFEGELTTGMCLFFLHVFVLENVSCFETDVMFIIRLEWGLAQQ